MLILAFLLSTIALIFQSIFLPHISILAFSPFLALALLRGTFHQALWLSCISGCIMDLISNDPMGVHALNYTLVAAILFKTRRHFLYDEPFHLSLLTAFFSFLSTIFQVLILFLFDRRVPVQGRWAIADFFGMPVIDGLYAFVWFAGPLALYSKQKKMWDLFWIKRKRASRTSH
ncbi:MAG: rod shape-determining protein MreD [Parachlamydiales bacterium]|nr:rod shape-determining protein MreD [Parachlamydiales bacterium]